LSLIKTFLDYTGEVDYLTIDQLLNELKNTSEYKELDKTTAKRVYSILVECLENIAKHSVKISHRNSNTEPSISAGKLNEKIIIKASNPIWDSRKEKLAAVLNLVNELDDASLTYLYEDKINGKSKSDNNGARLGFILIRLKSGNKIDFSFTSIDRNHSHFDLHILVNKYTMRKLIIEQTSSSPKVILDPDKNIFEISGESRPPDVAGFYGEILNWFDDYSSFLVKSPVVKEPVVFDLDFDYFNSSSAKYILDFCKQIASVRSKGKNIGVNWHYEKEDNDMLEAGKEMSRISKFPFDYVQR